MTPACLLDVGLAISPPSFRISSSSIFFLSTLILSRSLNFALYGIQALLHPRPALSLQSRTTSHLFFLRGLHLPPLVSPSQSFGSSIFWQEVVGHFRWPIHPRCLTVQAGWLEQIRTITSAITPAIVATRIPRRQGRFAFLRFLGGAPFRRRAWTGVGINGIFIGHVTALEVGCPSYVPSPFIVPSFLWLGFHRTLIFHLNRGPTEAETGKGFPDECLCLFEWDLI